MAFRMLNWAALVVAGVLAVGCDYEDDGYERDRSGDYLNDRDRYDDDYRDDDRDRDRDKDYYDRRPDRDDVPRGAVVIQEGAGKTLRHNPENSGRAYLYDMDERYVVYESRLEPGDKLTINPEEDAVKVNGVKDGKINLRAKHRYRLYYLRDDKARDGKGYDRKDRKDEVRY